MKVASTGSAISISDALVENGAGATFFAHYKGQHDMSEPLKVTLPSIGSQTKSFKDGSPLSAKTSLFAQSPTMDSMDPSFYPMPPVTSLMNYQGGFPMTSFNPMMPYPMMDPMMLAAMSTGMMGAMPMQDGSFQSQDQRASFDKRRPAKKEKKFGYKREHQRDEESSVVLHRNGQGKSKINLKSVMGQVVVRAVDEHGSRFLQQGLDGATDAEKAGVLEEMLPHMSTLSKDEFGTLVIQKLLHVGSTEQRKAIAEQFQGKVVDLSLDQHGCRVIQKALQLLPREAQMKLASEIEDKSGGTDKVIECIESRCGNHVIQMCVEQMPPDSVNFIIDSVSTRVEEMAEHTFGCRVIQRLLEHCAIHQLEGMLDKITAHTTELASHLYGNYVVQQMLERSRQEDKKQILDAITVDIVELAKSKVSRNVVAKCFEIASVGEHADNLRDERQRLYAALLTPQPGDPMPIKQLTEDKFGSYIVQRMIEYSRDPERGLLQQQLTDLIPHLQKSTHGKNICNAISKEFNVQVPTAPDEQ